MVFTKTYSTTIRAHSEFPENLQVRLLTDLQSKISLKYGSIKKIDALGLTFCLFVSAALVVD